MTDFSVCNNKFTLLQPINHTLRTDACFLFLLPHLHIDTFKENSDGGLTVFLDFILTK